MPSAGGCDCAFAEAGHVFTVSSKRSRTYLYRLNPLYASRGSDHYRELVVSLQNVLLEHQFEIPTVGKKEPSR